MSEIEIREVTKSSDEESTNKQSSEQTFSFDDIFHEIGAFGRYQIILGVLTGLVLLLHSSALFNFVFTSEIPDHRCVSTCGNWIFRSLF